MRIAVFHNYMDNIGGAEMLALYLSRGFKADLYTTNIDEEKIKKMGFSDVLERIISIGRLPKKAPFRQQLALWKFRRLNLKNKYDFFIIAGDWAMSATVNNKPNIWYVHSPLNELWEFTEFIKKNLLSFWKKPIYNLWVLLNRRLTIRYSKHVNFWVANSGNTKSRIKKFYNKDAKIIYPPVEINKFFDINKSKGDYWLSVNRLAVHKRVDIQLKAFSNLPEEKLIVVGSYEKNVPQFENYKKYLDKIKPDNVEIKHWLENDEIIDLYKNAKGFIATAKNEDFGMTLIEAMAAGLPVIAASEGGYKESVDESTGILIEDINDEKITLTIKSLNKELEENPYKFKENCYTRAKLFSLDSFLNKINELIGNKE